MEKVIPMAGSAFHFNDYMIVRLAKERAKDMMNSS